MRVREHCLGGTLPASRPPEAPDAPPTAAELLKVGNVLLLSNAQVKMFQGTPRLALDRSGTMQLAAEGTEVEPQVRALARAREYARLIQLLC